MKTLSTFALILLSAVAALAQEQTIDYIYSPEGFRVVNVSCPMYTPERGQNSQCTGLYSADGKVLLQAVYDTYYDRKGYFYVMAGTEVIAPHAFQAFEGGMVYIPSSVTTIAPDAFVSYSGKGPVVLGIYNHAYEDSSRIAAPKADNAAATEATEAARYTIDGRQIPSPQPGVNIVRLTDNTARKLLSE
ncbi:MAG: hypothetical protein HUK14_00645 [Muribaculaceae bacterium]|nr:hypothetical protein [Muribaculaceae bacterium]